MRCLQVITRTASTRVARYAFEYAKANNRKKVTAVHKANIMKKTDGLFIQCVREISQEYPDIAHDEMIVDNTCMQARAPHTSCRQQHALLGTLPGPASRAAAPSSDCVCQAANAARSQLLSRKLCRIALASLALCYSSPRGAR